MVAMSSVQCAKSYFSEMPSVQHAMLSVINFKQKKEINQIFLSFKCMLWFINKWLIIQEEKNSSEKNPAMKTKQKSKVADIECLLLKHKTTGVK
jgi:UDP-glucose 4-epimerase